MNEVVNSVDIVDELRAENAAFLSYLECYSKAFVSSMLNGRDPKKYPILAVVDVIKVFALLDEIDRRDSINSSRTGEVVDELRDHLMAGLHENAR